MDITKAEITKIAREVNKLAVRTLKRDGIGTSEFDLIHVVRKHDGISQSNICQILGTDKAAVAREVASLVKKGYLIKKKDPDDNRSSLIYPTEKAEELKVSKPCRNGLLRISPGGFDRARKGHLRPSARKDLSAL